MERAKIEPKTIVNLLTSVMFSIWVTRNNFLKINTDATYHVWGLGVICRDWKVELILATTKRVDVADIPVVVECLDMRWAMD